MDDTTLAEIVPRDSPSEFQRACAAAAVEQWSSDNKLQLNADKCEEMVIGFKLVKVARLSKVSEVKERLESNFRKTPTGVFSKISFSTINTIEIILSQKLNLKCSKSI